MNRLTGILAGLLLLPTVLGAQVVTLLTGGDSVVSVVVGDSTKVRLEVYSASGGISAYSVTIFLDNSRVQVVRADSVFGYGLPKPTLTPGADQVTLAASGGTYTGTTVELVDVWFKMDPAATQGSLISLKVNGLTSTTAADLLPGHRTTVVNLCQANTYWGDVTAEHVVNSRDALVALTAAVGLPTNGFDLSPGDVDADSVVSSRDALFILGYSIRLSVPSNRLGKPKTNRCAPLYPVPQDLLFLRSSDLFKIAAGDTLPVKFPLPTPAYLYTPDYRAVWSPDGTKVLYTGYNSLYYYGILASDGTRVDTLTRTTNYDAGADWSPDGTRIAFVSSRVSPAAVFVMNADGTGQQQVTFSPLTVNTSEPVSWDPSGTQVAFVGYSTCCNDGIWVVDADNRTTAEVLAGSLTQYPQQPVWNTAGDSILYRRGSYEAYMVSAIPGDTGRRMSRLNGGSDWPGTTTQGNAFRAASPYDIYLLRASDERHLRLVRGTFPYPYAISFRRAVPYVQTVAVSPKPVNVAVSARAGLTVAVTNSDAANNSSVPLTWVSRNTGVATVSPTGLRTADVTGVAPGSTYVVVTVRGWRSDSVLVTVP